MVHNEWRLYPMTRDEGVDEELLETEVLLKDGTWPDGFSQEEHEN